MHPKLQALISKHLKGDAPSPEMAALFADISKEWYRKTKLAEEARHMKIMQTVAKAGSWEASLDGNYKTNANYWSDELQRIMGVERDDVPHTYGDYVRFIHPDDRQRYEQAVRDALEADIRLDIEFRVINHQGVHKVLRDIAEVIKDPETGKPLKIVGISFDITDVRRTETALSDATRQLHLLMENMEEVFFSVDRIHPKILLMSPGSKRLYGYDTEAFLLDVHLWMDLIVEEDRARVYASEVQLAKGEHVTNEYRIRHANGSIRWVEARITPTLDAAGRLVRIDGLTSDITQRKEAELALVVTNEQLSKSNDELDRFVYSVSHDLRAPLASISGLIGYLASEHTDPALLGDLQLMKSSIDKLDVFILDILDYSRNARLELQPVEIDFVELLEEVKNNLKFMSSDKGAVDIRINVKLTQPFVSDKRRIYVVLSNLLSNAIRYYNPEAAQPFAEMSVFPVIGGVMLTVEDNGIGIDPIYQEKVFHMFYRVSDKSAGSGMGLYLVQETIQKLKGTIQLTSTPGEGSRFDIFIPDLSTP